MSDAVTSIEWFTRRVRGKRWRVFLSIRERTAELWNGRGEPSDGVTLSTGTIHVAAHLPAEERNETLWHEFSHVLCEQAQCSHRHEENAIRLLSPRQWPFLHAHQFRWPPLPPGFAALQRRARRLEKESA